jgi:hypothetical protein
MKTTAIDFDGVIGSYTGWKGPHHLGEPLPGAIEFLTRLIDHKLVPVIFSTREPEALQGWVMQHCPELSLKIQITREKPPAWLYIDDRCWLFTGSNWPTIEEIENFRTYWEKSAPC